MRPELIAFGASWGGLDALRAILGALPDRLPVSLLVVQHRGRDEGEGLVEVLQRSTALPVTEPVDKEKILPGRVYLAPADYHLLVDRRTFALSVDGLVNFARPSIDVTFESAAFAYGPRMVGVILSGAGQDGAVGLEAVARQGGLAVVQSAQSAQSAGMPAAALARVKSAKIVALPDLALLIQALCVPSRAFG